MTEITVLRNLTLKFKLPLDHIKRYQSVLHITFFLKLNFACSFFSLNVPFKSSFSISYLNNNKFWHNKMYLNSLKMIKIKNKTNKDKKDRENKICFLLNAVWVMYPRYLSRSSDFSCFQRFFCLLIYCSHHQGITVYDSLRHIH